MNLTPIQIAARNLLASISGLTPGDVEVAMQNPTLETMVIETIAPAFTGPFGDISDNQHQCSAREGAELAIDTFRNILSAYFDTGALTGPAVGDGRITDADREVFEEGIAEVQSLLDEFREDLFEGPVPEIDPDTALQTAEGFARSRIDAQSKEEETAGTDALADLFSSLFGRPVRVVKVG